MSFFEPEPESEEGAPRSRRHTHGFTFERGEDPEEPGEEFESSRDLEAPPVHGGARAVVATSPRDYGDHVDNMVCRAVEYTHRAHSKLNVLIGSMNRTPHDIIHSFRFDLPAGEEVDLAVTDTIAGRILRHYGLPVNEAQYAIDLKPVQEGSETRAMIISICRMDLSNGHCRNIVNYNPRNINAVIQDIAPTTKCTYIQPNYDWGFIQEYRMMERMLVGEEERVDPETGEKVKTWPLFRKDWRRLLAEGSIERSLLTENLKFGIHHSGGWFRHTLVAYFGEQNQTGRVIMRPGRNNGKIYWKINHFHGGVSKDNIIATLRAMRALGHDTISFSPTTGYELKAQMWRYAQEGQFDPPFYFTNYNEQNDRALDNVNREHRRTRGGANSPINADQAGAGSQEEFFRRRIREGTARANTFVWNP